MLPKNEQELDKIRKECRSMVDNSSLISGGAALIPVPGLDIAGDVGLLLDLLPKINRSFGLSPEQIDGLDPQRKMYIANLIAALGTQLVGQVLTKQLIMQVLKSVGIRMTAKQVVKYIPFVGQATAAGLSFAAMQYVGNNHIDDCYKVVKKIIEDKGYDVV